MRHVAYALVLVIALVYMNNAQMQQAAAEVMPAFLAGRHNEAMLLAFAAVVFGIGSTFSRTVVALDLSKLNDERLEELRETLSRLPGPETSVAIAKTQSLMSAISSIESGAATAQRATAAIAAASRAVASIDADEMREAGASVRAAVESLKGVSVVHLPDGLSDRLEKIKEQLDLVKEIAEEYDLDDISNQVDSIAGVAGELAKLTGRGDTQ